MSKAKKRTDTSRDAGGFVALPWSVLDCPAFSGLSMHARGLLLEVARQYVRDNNGRLLLTAAYLKERGWSSAAMIQKAKAELLAAGFIFETCKGQRPNKASWYAVTWAALDRHPGFDPGAFESFPRGAYRFADGKPKNPAPTWTRQDKNASLTPPHGVESPPIAPRHGVGPLAVAPPHGAMEATFRPVPTPSHGAHLEKPSAVMSEP